jgi:hypothetical protein
MKKNLLVALIAALSTLYELKAQRQVALYGEVGGPALLYSVNADIRFLKKNNGPGIRIGFQNFGIDFLYGLSDDSQSFVVGTGRVLSIPVGLNWVLGKGRVGLEMGGGVVPIRGNLVLPDAGFALNGWERYYFGEVGLRFKPRAGFGNVTRLMFTPLFIGQERINWFGLSTGIAF